MNVKEIYDRNKSKTSDINEHLPTLYEYANKCNHVTEMGARTGQSTSAFVYSKCKFFITYDLTISKHIIDLHTACVASTPDKVFRYQVGDSRTLDIEPTELLFIDTLHNYNQLKIELHKHEGKVSKYIILHDTTFWGHKDEQGTGPGLMPAVNEFLANNPQWHIIKQYENNSGLTIIGR